jgi:putative transposase
LFGGTVGKDTVSRTWRKVKRDWDAWHTRSLTGEPIVRLILDGTVVRVRLDRQATSNSLLVVLGVREDGQKVLLAIRSMGGESAEAWRTVLADLINRGLRRPEFLIVDGAPGLDKAIASVWAGVPVQRCTVHKHRNLFAHAPERLHDEITADYNDMIYATTPEEIEARRKAFIRKWRLKSSRRRRQPGRGRRTLVHLHAPATEPMAQRAYHQCNRAVARRVQAKDQNANRAAVSRHRSHAVLGAARLRTDQVAQGRWLATLTVKPSNQIDLAA